MQTATLIEGDCLKVLPDIKAGSVDLILADLPYGTTQNNWDSLIPLSDLWENFRRVLATNGAVILTGHGLFTASLMLSNPDWFKYKMTWIKSKSTNFLNAKKQPLRKHEDICVFYNKQPFYDPQMSEGKAYDKGYRKNQHTGSYGEFGSVRVQSRGSRYPTDVVYFATAESEGQVYHPTQKPISLARYLVRTYCPPGGIVLDPTFGAGSFLVGAAIEGRDSIGIELNKDIKMFKNSESDLDLIEVARHRIASHSPSVRIDVAYSGNTDHCDQRFTKSQTRTAPPGVRVIEIVLPV